MVYYNFDQFLYTTKADGSQGIGILVGSALPIATPTSSSSSTVSGSRQGYARAGP